MTQADPSPQLVEQPGFRGAFPVSPGVYWGTGGVFVGGNGVFMSRKSLTISEVHGHGRSIHRPVAGVAPRNTPSEGVNCTEIGVH